MTDAEIRAHIKKECPHITDKFIDNFMEHNNMTLQEYLNWFDRALAARRRDNPNYPNSLRPSEED